MLNKTMDLLAFPAQLEVASSWVVPLQVACVGLCIVGMVAVIVRRRFDVAVLLLVPWIIGLAFNVAGKWPWGVFRTNVFLLFYVLTLVTEGLSALAIVGRQRPDLWRVAPWGGILIGIALFPFDLSPFSVKKQETLTLSTSVRTAMELSLIHIS